MVKRSKFWTVVFSFLPGAGHMFMGFMKQGTSLMVAFFGLFAVSSWLSMGELNFLIPVLWFYSFFDCMNKRFSTDVAFMQFEDKFLFEDWFKSKKGANLGRYNTIISVLLIMVGVYMVLTNVWRALYWNGIVFSPVIEAAVDTIFDRLPQIAIGVLIVVFGIKLIKGKKKEMNDDE